MNLKETKQKIKEHVSAVDFIMQTINNIDELDKAANLLSKRLREWYALYNPEFTRTVESHEKFAEIVQKKTRKELLKEIGLEEKESMGAEINKEDLEPVMSLAKNITELFRLRKEQEEYLEKVMKKNLPNLHAVAGANVGARLLMQAGSMKRLVGFPSSTIQILGAEKALFRHMKTGARSPKHGFIINHPFVTNAKREYKGKAARMLADKISIAVKIDYFKGKFIGDKLRKELEEKLK